MESAEAKRRRVGTDEAVMPAPDMMMGMSRSMVTMMQFNEQKQDYISSLSNMEEDTPEYNAALQAGCLLPPVAKVLGIYGFGFRFRVGHQKTLQAVVGFAPRFRV
ncbi:adck1 [Symbiodinium sp. KB8]|nr:adck1 [Symbiodinium sp. KB8]